MIILLYMNIFLMIFLIFIHIILAIFLCFIILLQKPDGSISINQKQSSRSENVVLVNTTIIVAILFFGLSISANAYSEYYKRCNGDLLFNKNIDINHNQK
jgi:protein translocase SecG subunit